MLKNGHLSKAISEASWSQFRTMLEYKAEWYGKQLLSLPKTLPVVSSVPVVVKKIKTLRISHCVIGLALLVEAITKGTLTQE
jgi:transposase